MTDAVELGDPAASPANSSTVHVSNSHTPIGGELRERVGMRGVHHREAERIVTVRPVPRSRRLSPSGDTSTASTPAKVGATSVRKIV